MQPAVDGRVLCLKMHADKRGPQQHKDGTGMMKLDKLSIAKVYAPRVISTRFNSVNTKRGRAPKDTNSTPRAKLCTLLLGENRSRDRGKADNEEDALFWSLALSLSVNRSHPPPLL